MAKMYGELSAELRAFIEEQKIYFVATVPGEGRINLSPKGMDSFRCLSNQQVAFLNLTGSGNETAAHLADSQRLTIMFCSFTKRPQILRLYGTGKAVHPRDGDWHSLYPLFPPSIAARQIITMRIESVQTSCGYGVPFFDYVEEREALAKWADAKGEAAIHDYWESTNLETIDRLPTYLLDDLYRRE